MKVFHYYTDRGNTVYCTDNVSGGLRCGKNTVAMVIHVVTGSKSDGCYDAILHMLLWQPSFTYTPVWLGG